MSYTSSGLRGLSLLVLAFLLPLQSAFVVPVQSSKQFCNRSLITSRINASENSSPRMGELTPPEQKVYDLLSEIHVSKYPFRVVVIGGGAILETTHELGPVLKITQQPSTGANLMTLASQDKSFEFHVRLSQVSKMVLTVKESPSKVLRILRLLNSSGESLASLILASDEEDAIKWFQQLIEKYGEEIQL